MPQNLITKLKTEQNFREIPALLHAGKYIIKNGQKLLNLASNDYMAIAQNSDLTREFLLNLIQNLDENSANFTPNFSNKNALELRQNLDKNSKITTQNEPNFATTNAQPKSQILTQILNQPASNFCNKQTTINCTTNLSQNTHQTNQFFAQFGSTSSRSLSGNFDIFDAFESEISRHFTNETAGKTAINFTDKSDNKSTLLFNSGYHLNTACVGAFSHLKNTLIIADRQIHASIIDGIILSRAPFLRFLHADIKKLTQILEREHTKYERILIISEALFSMDGDFCDILELVALKKRFSNVLLYIDEAHSVGAIGEKGLGLCAKMGVANDIDFIVYTFGKALGSVGACMICAPIWRDFFVNFARGLIYSTALAPINIAWSKFAFEKLLKMEHERTYLADLCTEFKRALQRKNYEILGDAHIISIITGDNKSALNLAQKLQNLGYFAPAIRTPTVANGSQRIRLSLHAGLKMSDLEALIDGI